MAPSTTIYSDRFIPSRSGSNFSLYDALHSNSSSSSPSSFNGFSGGAEGSSSGAYSTLLREVLLGQPATGNLNTNILRFKAENQWSPHVEFDGVLPKSIFVVPKTSRGFPKSPYKVLDAPDLQDDFYSNLVDWSSRNVLAVGLGSYIYLLNDSSKKVTKLCHFGMADGVCSLEWSQNGTYLAVGTDLGGVQIWDASRCKIVRIMEGHDLRVGSLAWSSSLLASGSKDATILLHDIRARRDSVNKLMGHKSQVCSLKWSNDNDNSKLASGGNDSKVLVWNQHSTKPILKYCEHKAAVKAIAWSPHQFGLLASGGGKEDQCIRFWNTTSNSHLSWINTGSQVSNLLWSKNVNELVSTHGYSQNQIIVWRYPTMSKLATLTGHTSRVLYLAISPDGERIVTGAGEGDQTLRFWKIFPRLKSQKAEGGIGASSLGRTQIR